jgi:hypothetical protein
MISNKSGEIMKRKFKQWCSTILPISTKQTITSHLNSIILNKRQQHTTLSIQVLAWDRHKQVAGLKQLMESQPSLLCALIIVSEWLLLNTQWAIFKLYQGENKLPSNKMMMMTRPNKKICVFTVTRPTLTFFISNYSTLIFAGDPVNFYTEFG